MCQYRQSWIIWAEQVALNCQGRIAVKMPGAWLRCRSCRWRIRLLQSFIFSSTTLMTPVVQTIWSLSRLDRTLWWYEGAELDFQALLVTDILWSSHWSFFFFFPKYNYYYYFVFVFKFLFNFVKSDHFVKKRQQLFAGCPHISYYSMCVALPSEQIGCQHL